MRIVAFPAVLLLFLVTCYCAATTVYVDAAGPDDPGPNNPSISDPCEDGSFGHPFDAIQEAIDIAVDGNIIEIRPGLYTGEGNYDLDPNGAAITIRSTEPNDPNIVANTIIDPNRAGRGFYINSAEEPNCIISGLTIRNAYTVTGYNGGGIYCYNSDPTIRNCIIKNGHATGSGGGVFCDIGTPKIINCIITANSADYYGGGIGCVQSNAEIIGCTINDNNSTYEGGGLDFGESNPTVLNSIIISNKAFYGGGINCYSLESNEANLVNCTISRNSATMGGGLSCQYGGGATVKNSIFRANEASQGGQTALLYEAIASVSYSDFQGGELAVYDPCNSLIWGSGNINADPCFASFDPDGDPNLWDFHLKSTVGRWDGSFYRIDFNNDRIVNLVDFNRLAGVWLKQGDNLPEDLNRNGTIDGADLQIFTEYFLTGGSAGKWVSDASSSDCIDAGDPASDWSAELWPNGKHINMGAYGGTNQASMNGNEADFDVDGVVNFSDFATLATRWLSKDSCIEDLSKNGMVDFSDLGIFAANWLWQE